MKAGFTLLEVLVVLGILGVLLGLSGSGLNEHRQRAILRDAAQTLVSDFGRAKTLARRHNREVMLTVDTTAAAVTITDGATVVSSRTLSVDELTLTCATTCASGTFSFRAPFGTLSNDARFTLRRAGHTLNAYLLGPTAIEVIR